MSTVTSALRRIGAIVVLAGALLVVLAGPAAAHGRGADATNYRGEITDVPDAEGIEWRIYGGDELIWVENPTDEELLVLGEAGEPFLRIGPGGVFENLRSPQTYLSRDRYAQVVVPETADASAEPEWEQRSGGTSWSWHDHRAHLMSRTVPPELAAATEPVVVASHRVWEVPLDLGGRPETLVGTLWWVPGPSPWPWLLAAAPVALLGLIGLRTRPDGERWPGLARPAAILLGGTVATNLPNLVNDLVAVPLRPGELALALIQTGLFLGIAALGAVRGWQARDGAFTALAVGSGSLLIGQGLLLWPVIGASQLSTVFPDWVSRASVSLSLVQAPVVFAVALIGTRHVARTLAAAELAGPDAGGADASGQRAPAGT